MSEISKEQFMISELAAEVANLKTALAEKEFYIRAMDQKIKELEGKEENDGEKE